MGRKPIGEEPMTSAERQRRSRAKRIVVQAAAKKANTRALLRVISEQQRELDNLRALLQTRLDMISDAELARLLANNMSTDRFRGLAAGLERILIYR
jgi:hypothetical protein